MSTKDGIVRGARRIAKIVFEDESQTDAIYRLKDELGLFYLGGMIAGRPSTIRQRLARIERGEGKGRREKESAA
jgi:hypothetical protein